jgi:hypothetical protein
MDNVMPFSPGVLRQANVQAFDGRALDTVQVSSKATLKDLLAEFDVMCCGLLSIPPLTQVPLLEEAERSARRTFGLGFLDTPYPITVGHGVVFSHAGLTALDYRLLLLEKDSLGELIMHLNASSIVAVEDEQGQRKRLHLRVKSLMLSDVLQAETQPQREPELLRIALVDVVGTDAAWVYTQHQPSKLPQLRVGKLQALVRNGLLTGSHRAFNEMLDRFYAGDSDPYAARSFVAQESRPFLPPVRGVFDRP